MNKLFFQGESYLLTVTEDSFSVCVGKEKQEYFHLSVRSSVHTEEQKDVDEKLLAREIVEQNEKSLVVVWKTLSNLWQEKEYRLAAEQDGFLYSVRVKGNAVDVPFSVDYFGNGVVARYGSKYEVSEYLLPLALNNEQPSHIHCISQNESIEMGYFTPPMYCFPYHLEGEEDWFGLGLVAKQGQHNYEELRHCCDNNRMYLSVPYYRPTLTDGWWEAPAILGCRGDSGIHVLENYSEWYYKHGYANRHCYENIPRWWKGPLVCGWGEQWAVASQERLNIYSLANQNFYTQLSENIDKKGLHPTAIIIDDKWQTHYGEALPDPSKWRDLRAFTDAEHAKGRKVILWFKTWNAEGLPSNECIDYYCMSVAADPTNEAYRERMKKVIHQLFSEEEGCYNCDGFKVDFANCMPKGKLMRVKENQYCGVELLHKMFELLYTTAKAVKPDALINCSSCHPYFAEYNDQARLHDYTACMRNQCSHFLFRRDIYRAAMPGVSIDTDGASQSSHRDMMAYTRLAPQIGVPDIYTISNAEDCVLTEEDWDEIRTLWAEYSARMDRESAKN